MTAKIANIQEALEQMQLERTKGEIRALVALRGSRESDGTGKSIDDYSKLFSLSERFIADLEERFER